MNEGLEDKEEEKLEFRVLTAGWMEPLICIPIPPAGLTGVLLTD